MARARNIKPSISKNEDLAEMSAHTRLLFLLLPCYADCEGKLEDRPKRLHVEIFPYEPKLNVNKMLEELHKGKFITRYMSESEKFIWINNFLKHQSPHKHEREKGSDIPDFNSNLHGPEILDTEPENRGTAQADSLNLSPDSLNLSPLTPDSDIVQKIADFYKKEINSEEIASGKRNLQALHKKSKISFEDLFQRVKYYYEHLQLNGNLGTRYTYRMRNFFGRAAYHEDYTEGPKNGPQNAPEKTGAEKSGAPAKDKDYGEGYAGKLK